MQLSNSNVLTEAELDRLSQFLSTSQSSEAMNLEAMDGLFAALIAGPEVVPPSEYLPLVFGGEMSETVEFSGVEEANEILGLLMRHWNGIASTLAKGAVPLPLLLEDDNGVCKGSDWARGFMRGVATRKQMWAELFDNEDQYVWMLPVLVLYHEHDDDPDLRPEPIEPEKRELIFARMAEAVTRIYQLFRAQSPKRPAKKVAHISRFSKVGRNDHCPCGSGKKYKRCCGGVTIH